MNLFDTIRDIINPPELTLQQLSVGMCVLPPRRVVETKKAAKATDLYVIDEQHNVFGFNQNTASRQTEGSTADLTGFDIRLLEDRQYWGGRAVREKNARCKAMWHNGDTEKECAASLGVSESWVEKRFGTFGSALIEEQSQSK